MGYRGTENEIENLADVIADGALDDDDIATVMGVES
jgi:hypothetical protein